MAKHSKKNIRASIRMMGGTLPGEDASIAVHLGALSATFAPSRKARGAANRHTREARRVEVASLMAQGLPVAAISESLRRRGFAASSSVIATDIRVIEKLWRDDQVEKRSKYVDRQLLAWDARLKIQYEAFSYEMEQYVESRKLDNDADGKPILRVSSYGPWMAAEAMGSQRLRSVERILKGIARMEEDRRDLLGLDAPEQLDLVVRIQRIAESEGWSEETTFEAVERARVAERALVENN